MMWGITIAKYLLSIATLEKIRAGDNTQYELLAIPRKAMC